MTMPPRQALRSALHCYGSGSMPAIALRESRIKTSVASSCGMYMHGIVFFLNIFLHQVKITLEPCLGTQCPSLHSSKGRTCDTCIALLLLGFRMSFVHCLL